MDQGFKYQFERLPIKTKYSIINLLYFVALVDNNINPNANFIKELEFINDYVNHFGFVVTDAHDYYKRTGSEKLIENLNEMYLTEKFYLYMVTFFLMVSDGTLNQTEFEKTKDFFEAIGFSIERQAEILSFLDEGDQNKCVLYLVSLNIEEYVIKQIHDFNKLVAMQPKRDDMIALIEYNINKFTNVIVSSPNSPIKADKFFMIMADVKKNVRNHFKVN